MVRVAAIMSDTQNRLEASLLEEHQSMALHTLRMPGTKLLHRAKADGVGCGCVQARRHDQCLGSRGAVAGLIPGHSSPYSCQPCLPSAQPSTHSSLHSVSGFHCFIKYLERAPESQ